MDGRRGRVRRLAFPLAQLGRLPPVDVSGGVKDGRAFRYAKPGVRWYEVDHPATQLDGMRRWGYITIDGTAKKIHQGGSTACHNGMQVLKDY